MARVTATGGTVDAAVGELWAMSTIDETEKSLVFAKTFNRQYEA